MSVTAIHGLLQPIWSVLPTPLSERWRAVRSIANQQHLGQEASAILELALTMAGLIELARWRARVRQGHAPSEDELEWLQGYLRPNRGARTRLMTGGSWAHVYAGLCDAPPFGNPRKLRGRRSGPLNVLLDAGKERNDVAHRNDISNDLLARIHDALHHLPCLLEGRLVLIPTLIERTTSDERGRITVFNGPNVNGHPENAAWASRTRVAPGLYWVDAVNDIGLLIPLHGLIECTPGSGGLDDWTVAGDFTTSSNAQSASPLAVAAVPESLNIRSGSRRRVEGATANDLFNFPEPARVDWELEESTLLRATPSEGLEGFVVPGSTRAFRVTTSGSEVVAAPDKLSVPGDRRSRLAFVAGVLFTLSVMVLIGLRMAPDSAEPFWPTYDRTWEFNTESCRTSADGRFRRRGNGANYELLWRPEGTPPLSISRQMEGSGSDIRTDSQPIALRNTRNHMLLRAALCGESSCDEPEVVIYLVLERDNADLHGFFVSAVGPLRPLWGTVSVGEPACEDLHVLSTDSQCVLSHILDHPFSLLEAGFENDGPVRDLMIEAFDACM